MADTNDFWSTPQGQWAKKVWNPLILIGGGIALFVFWGAISAWVAATLENTALAIAYGIPVALFLYMLIDGDGRRLLGLAYRWMMRAATQRFIETNPIGIMRDHVKDAEETDKDVKNKLGAVEGQKEYITGKLEKAQADLQKFIHEATYAENKPELHDGFIFATNQIGRLEEASKDYEKQLADVVEIIAILVDLEKAAAFMIKDVTATVDLMEERWETAKATAKATKGLKSLLQGSSTQELFDASCRHVLQDYSAKMGEIKSLRRDANGFLQSVDMKNGVRQENAKEIIAKYRARTQNVLVRVDPSVVAAPVATKTAHLDEWFADDSNSTSTAARKAARP